MHGRCFMYRIGPALYASCEYGINRCSTPQLDVSYDFRYPEMPVRTAQCRGKKLMDKYMIVFRWLAQLGGASSCMYLTETNLAVALKPLGQLQ